MKQIGNIKMLAAIMFLLVSALFFIGNAHLVKAYNADDYGHSFIYQKTCSDSSIESHSRFSVFDLGTASGCKNYNRCTNDHSSVLDVVCIYPSDINSKAGKDYPGKHCSSYVVPESENSPYHLVYASQFGPNDEGNVRVLDCSGYWGSGKCEDKNEYGQTVTAHCCLLEGGDISKVPNKGVIDPLIGYNDDYYCCVGYHATNGHCCKSGEVWNTQDNRCETPDNTAPSTTINPNGHSWTNQDVSFSLTCSDLGSGCSRTYYKIIDEWDACGSFGYSTGTSGSVSCSSGSTCKKRICYYSVDNAGNTESVHKSATFYIDKQVPSTSISPNSHSWTKSDVSFSLSCSDGGSGCAHTYYDIVGEYDSCPSAGSYSYEEGDFGTVSCSYGSVCKEKVCYYSVDNSGNVESVHQSDLFKIDKTSPETTIYPDGGSFSDDVSVSLTCSDTGSGCSGTYYKVVDASTYCSSNDYSGFSYGNSFTIRCDGNCQKKVCYYSVDNAGNKEGVETSSTFTITKQKPNTCPVWTVQSLSYSVNRGDTFTLDLSDYAYDADGDLLYYYSDGSLPYGASLDRLSGLFSWSTGSASVGQHSFYFYVSDSECRSVDLVVSVDVEQSNHEPSVSNVYITPNQPYTTDDLTCHYTFYDRDGDSDLSSVYWFKNGVKMSFTGKVLPHTYTEKGDVIVCEVVPFDGKEYGTAVDSSSVVILNSCPEWSVFSLTYSTTIGKEVSFNAAQYVTDADDDIITFTMFGNPSGSSIDQNGEFSWTPQTGQEGAHNFYIIASDNECSSNVQVEIIVNKPVPSLNAVLEAIPVQGYAPLQVHFNASKSTGNIARYCINYGDGQSYCSEDPLVVDHTYNSVGIYTATLTVTDAYGNFDTDSVVITVLNKPIPVTPTLKVVSINCFSRITVGNNQSCSILVEDDKGNKVGGADVTVYFDDGSFFGSCTTDSITGGCSVKKLMASVGTYTVYATAEKSGYNPDLDKTPSFTFEVMKKRYTIYDLKIYNDSEFMQEDDVFYRGENMYVMFKVKDDYTDEPVDDIVSQVTLVSPPGGRVNLQFLRESNGAYYYQLAPIPTTHMFLGSSQVFSFVFNFTDNSSGQLEAPVTILNNPPKIIPPINNLTVIRGSQYILNLAQHEFDVEDSGSNLSWSVVDYPRNLVTYYLNGKELILTSNGLEGNGTLTLKLTDLDGAYATETINLTVKRGVNHAPYFISKPVTFVRAGETYEYYPVAVDPDKDSLTYELVESPDGMTLRQDVHAIIWRVPLSYAGKTVNVSVTAADPYGLQAVQTYQIRVGMPAEQILPRRRVFVSTLRIEHEDCLKPGEDMFVWINFKNLGFYDLEGVKIRAVVHSIDSSTMIGPISVDAGQEISKVLLMHIDDNAEPGHYYVRFTLYNDRIRRVLYREFIITKKSRSHGTTSQ